MRTLSQVVCVADKLNAKTTFQYRGKLVLNVLIQRIMFKLTCSHLGPTSRTVASSK